MKEWGQYAQSRNSQGGGVEGTPSVREYLLIKLADNWIAVTVVIVMLLFAVGGIVCLVPDKPAVNDASKWFLDGAKLCLGVFLGLLTTGRK